MTRGVFAETGDIFDTAIGSFHWVFLPRYWWLTFHHIFGGIRGVAEVLAAQQAEEIMVSKQLLDSLELVSHGVYSVYVNISCLRSFAAYFGIAVGTSRRAIPSLQHK